MKAVLVSALVLAFSGFAGPQLAASADSSKAAMSDAELAKCSLKRAQCLETVKTCLDTGNELACRQAQQICERVDPGCPD